MSNFKFGERSQRRYKGVNPLLIQCASNALALSFDDMTIPWMGGLRTSEDQNAIFKTGNSRCDGYKKKSYHQSGNAIDIIPVLGGYENLEAFERFAVLMKSEWVKLNTGMELTWGGDWKNFVDRPHWQIK